jgi:hypothetical protein
MFFAIAFGFYVHEIICMDNKTEKLFVISSELITTNGLDSQGHVQLVSQFVPILGTIFKKRSWIELGRLTCHAPSLITKGKEYAEGTDPKKKGLSNIVDAISDELQAKEMTPLSDQEKLAFVDACTKPQPRPDMIECLKKISNPDLILATNQDINEHGIYQEKLRKEYKINIFDLFMNGVVTTPHYKSLQEKKSSHEHFYKISDQLIVAHDRIGTQQFESALDQLNPEKKKIVFLTSKKEYYQAWQNSEKITPAFCTSVIKFDDFLTGKSVDYEADYPLAEDYLEKPK